RHPGPIRRKGSPAPHGSWDNAVGQPRWPSRGGRWIGFALTGELHQVRTEVAVREVAVPGGSAHDPERVGDLDIVAGVTGSAVVVDVEGEPGLAGVLEHERAVGVIKAGAAGGEDGDGDGAVAVIDNRVVPAVDAEDVGEGAAGFQVGGDDGAVHALAVVRER